MHRSYHFPKLTADFKSFNRHKPAKDLAGIHNAAWIERRFDAPHQFPTNAYMACHEVEPIRIYRADFQQGEVR